MKVRATSYDYVEWNVQPFLPGKLFWQPDNNLKQIKSDKNYIKLQVPSRLDPVVLDYAKLHPTSEENDYKAGAVGFGVGLYTLAEITLTDNPDIEAKGDSPLVAKHIASIMKQTTKYEGGFSISCKSHNYKHMGFSSTGSLSSAVANGINILLGNPYTDDSLVKLVAHNYAEDSELKEGYLTPGISTGSSGHIAQKGGITVVSSDCELIMRRPIPEGTKIVYGVPPIESGGKGPETSDVDVHSLSWIRHIDRFNAAKVCYWILMDFMPAMNQGNLKNMGNVLYDTMFCGSKGAPLAPMHGGDLLGVIFEQRVSGVETCFMSSAGPALVALTQDKEEVAERIFEKYNFKTFKTEPDNQGSNVLLKE
ncbi:hypothetical protein COS83_02410 [archaeon CG07_land_8_20_14_0_80_38_8]|nr:MAG: hypothetical protein COS83_02410 [archaeon CG07_land_8_20_14_0_80_38_8]